jgi:hypothetical protein
MIGNFVGNFALPLLNWTTQPFTLNAIKAAGERAEDRASSPGLTNDLINRGQYFFLTTRSIIGAVVAPLEENETLADYFSSTCKYTYAAALSALAVLSRSLPNKHFSTDHPWLDFGVRSISVAGASFICATKAAVVAAAIFYVAGIAAAKAGIAVWVIGCGSSLYYLGTSLTAVASKIASAVFSLFSSPVTTISHVGQWALLSASAHPLAAIGIAVLTIGLIATGIYAHYRTREEEFCC